MFLLKRRSGKIRLSGRSTSSRSSDRVRERIRRGWSSIGAGDDTSYRNTVNCYRRNVDLCLITTSDLTASHHGESNGVDATSDQRPSEDVVLREFSDYMVSIVNISHVMKYVISVIF